MKTPSFLLPLLLALAAFRAMPASQAAEPLVWHVKAIHPEGRLLDIKAFDSTGKPINIKAIQTEGNTHLLDVKGLQGETILAVKVMTKPTGDKYHPVKAIAENGTIYPIKALTAEGKKLDVKGVEEHGNVISIKAVAEDGTFYGIKAISPEGRVYDIKGIKTSGTPVEGKVGSVEFFAHVKGLPQAP